MVKAALPKLDDLLMASWNVVSIYEHAGSDCNTLSRSIKDLSGVLKEFQGTFSRANATGSIVKEPKETKSPADELSVCSKDRSGHSAIMVPCENSRLLNIRRHSGEDQVSESIRGNGRENATLFHPKDRDTLNSAAMRLPREEAGLHTANHNERDKPSPKSQRLSPNQSLKPHSQKTLSKEMQGMPGCPRVHSHDMCAEATTRHDEHPSIARCTMRPCSSGQLTSHRNSTASPSRQGSGNGSIATVAPMVSASSMLDLNGLTSLGAQQNGWRY